jgi:hypothetical protein
MILSFFLDENQTLERKRPRHDGGTSGGGRLCFEFVSSKSLRMLMDLCVVDQSSGQNHFRRSSRGVPPVVIQFLGFQNMEPDRILHHHQHKLR